MAQCPPSTAVYSHGLPCSFAHSLSFGILAASFSEWRERAAARTSVILLFAFVFVVVFLILIHGRDPRLRQTPCGSVSLSEHSDADDGGEL